MRYQKRGLFLLSQLGIVRYRSKFDTWYLDSYYFLLKDFKKGVPVRRTGVEGAYLSPSQRFQGRHDPPSTNNYRHQNYCEQIFVRILADLAL